MPYSLQNSTLHQITILAPVDRGNKWLIQLRLEVDTTAVRSKKMIAILSNWTVDTEESA